MLCRKGSLDGTATFTYIPLGDKAQVFLVAVVCSLLVEEIAKLQGCQVSLFVDFCKKQKFLIKHARDILRNVLFITSMYERPKMINIP